MRLPLWSPEILGELVPRILEDVVEIAEVVRSSEGDSKQGSGRIVTSVWEGWSQTAVCHPELVEVTPSKEKLKWSCPPEMTLQHVVILQPVVELASRGEL